MQFVWHKNYITEILFLHDYFSLNLRESEFFEAELYMSIRTCIYVKKTRMRFASNFIINLLPYTLFKKCKEIHTAGREDAYLHKERSYTVYLPCEFFYNSAGNASIVFINVL